MSDLPNRLRFGTALRNHASLIELCEQAANEIERLHDSVIDLRALVSDLNAEIERLLGRLDKIAKHPDATKLIRQYAASDL